MNRVEIAGVLLSALAWTGGVHATEPASAVVWSDKPTQAFAASSDSARPVAVDFWAIWCEPCKLMEATTYRDPRVVAAMDHFVPLKVNGDTNEIFAERYSVEAYPTLLFLDQHGNEITRLTGMIEAPELLETLAHVRDGYEAYLSHLAARDDPRSVQAAAAYLRAAGNGSGAAKLLRGALKVAKKSDPTAVESIECDLAYALLAEGRAAAAAKTLQRLSESASNADVRLQALIGLERAEHERGREDKAADVRARLAREHPELAGE